MIRHRVIKGVLHNFLGTYVSRNSDFEGYWLFGFIVEEIQQVRINLINKNLDDSNRRIMIAERVAIQRFTELANKAGMQMSWLNEAYLEITKLISPLDVYVNDRLCTGYKLLFKVHVETDLGISYENSSSLIVAPHNPEIEKRRRKDDWYIA
jgi:hypothetical protein